MQVIQSGTDLNLMLKPSTGNFYTARKGERQVKKSKKSFFMEDGVRLAFRGPNPYCPAPVVLRGRGQQKAQ